MATRPSRSAAATRRELDAVDGVTQFAFLIHGALERRAAEHDLSIVQTRLLGVLRDRTPTMNELATLLGLDKSSITGLIDRAERRGLVQRAPSPNDRRAVRVRLTDAARALVSQVQAGYRTDVAAIVQSLPRADRDALTALVSRVLVAHAEQHGLELFPGPGT